MWAWPDCAMHQPPASVAPQCLGLIGARGADLLQHTSTYSSPTPLLASSSCQVPVWGKNEPRARVRPGVW